MPSAPSTEKLSELLHRVFGHREFRAHQEVVCEAAANGRDVLLVMPTGAGKSLCYQLPALASGGTALVISPLIALMDDQATKLASLGLRVARIHSGLSREHARQACRDYLDGSLDFLFIAPERMRVPGFPDMLARRKPTLIAIDEAHCISQWGHDFRPDYRTLGQHLPALRPASIVALTATATPAVQKDIAHQLQLNDPAIFITGFRRENLAIEVAELSKPQRAAFTADLLAKPGTRPAIVYAPSRKAAEELATKLNASFPARAYHAGLEPGVRERVQRDFLGGKLEVVVATVAFGMGVDKADVRTVIHIALPGSVEGYYQEIGRAGRDGKPSRTVLLHNFADRKLQEFFLERSYPPADDLERVAAVLSGDFEPPEQLVRRLSMDRETLDRVLEKLLAQGVAMMDMAGAVRATGETGWRSGYDTQVAFRRREIDRMIAFTESTTCRMAALVEHFGDTAGAARPCGICDVCNPACDSGSRAPTAEERDALRLILASVEVRSTSTGKLFELVSRDRSASAALRDRKEFNALLDALARAGLLTITKDTFRGSEGNEITYRKAAITHEGRSPDDGALDTVWIRGQATAGTTAGKRRARGAEVSRRPTKRLEQKEIARRVRGVAAVPERKPQQTGISAVRQRVSEKPARLEASAPAELNERQREIDARLRAWRREEAKRAGLPTFFIFSDTVLSRLVQSSPQSLAELEAVRGLEADKLERFGPALLALCRS